MWFIGILIEDNCHYSSVFNELILPNTGNDLKIENVLSPQQTPNSCRMMRLSVNPALATALCTVEGWRQG